MRGVFIVLCVAVAAQAASLYQDEWQAFKTQYNKVYSGEEDAFRYKVFVENSKLVEEHNRLYDQGLSTFTMKMNKYGDLLSHEFASMLNGYKSEMKKPSSKIFDATSDALPESVDWRDKGVVTPIKDQGQCGSCWSFSSTGSLEGQHALKTGKLVSLSEQNLVDCTKTSTYGNEGCGGGWMDASFQYIADNDGIDTEASYPYTARDGTCSFKAAFVGATDTGYTDIRKGSESALQEASATVGPIAVAIDASHSSFQLYHSGVYTEPLCSTTRLDHAVLVVGYGTSVGKDYWLVKNSWGTSWGEQGYIQMARNDNNMCGIATQASYPKV